MKKLFLFLVSVLLLAAHPARAVDIVEVTAPRTGIKAWLVQDHTLPIVALRFAFRGGSEQDPADKQGLENLTADLLTEGAGNYSADAFQKQLAAHSISIGLGAERDEISGGLKCLSDDKARAFDLLHVALTKPRFDTKDIERLRARQLAMIRQQYADPEWQGRYALFSQIFAGHPYSERHLGSEQTLASITRADIVSFADAHLARDNLIIGAAGDMSPDDLADAIDRIFGDLPAHAQLTPVADVTQPAETPTILVRRAGTQTDILFAMPGPKREDPDWYAADIANYILGGGGFSSRLMHDVRDKKGLTYGVDTGLAPSDHSGLIIGQAAVDNPRVADALEVMRDTMRHFHDDGATAKEIAAAKDYLTGSRPRMLTTTDKIAEVLVTMQRDNLGMDYLDRYGEIIRHVTADDISRVIERWFDPDKATWVMVGSPEGVTPTITRDTVRQ